MIFPDLVHFWADVDWMRALSQNGPRTFLPRALIQSTSAQKCTRSGKITTRPTAHRNSAISAGAKLVRGQPSWAVSWLVES